MAKEKVKKIVVEPKAERNFEQDFEYVCLEIEKGRALRKCCTDFMSVDKFHSMCKESADLNERYARAKDIQADYLFDELKDISDGDDIIDDQVKIQRDRLKIDARKWILAKMAPKRYGDKIEIDSTSKVEITQRPDFTKLSKEELKNLIELQRKAKSSDK